MREYFVLSRYYKNKRSKKLLKKIDRETPSVRERLLMWGRRDREQERMRDSMSVCERKRERKRMKRTESVGLWERGEDRDSFWQWCSMEERERVKKERDNERLWECLCVWERKTERQREN